MQPWRSIESRISYTLDIDDSCQKTPVISLDWLCQNAYGSYVESYGLSCSYAAQNMQNDIQHKICKMIYKSKHNCLQKQENKFATL